VVDVAGGVIQDLRGLASPWLAELAGALVELNPRNLFS
jgi:hypothetical protein